MRWRCFRKKASSRSISPRFVLAVAEVAQCLDHLGDAAGVVAQDLSALLEPVGRRRVVRGHAEMLAGVPEVDDIGLGREALEEGLVVGGAVGHGADPDLRAHTPDMGDPACELRLQRGLAALGHAAEIEGSEPFALGVVEGDRAA